MEEKFDVVIAGAGASGLMCAWQKTGGDGHDFAQAARNAAIAMKEDIGRYVTVL